MIRSDFWNAAIRSLSLPDPARTGFGASFGSKLSFKSLSFWFTGSPKAAKRPLRASALFALGVLEAVGERNPPGFWNVDIRSLSDFCEASTASFAALTFLVYEVFLCSSVISAGSSFFFSKVDDVALLKDARRCCNVGVLPSTALRSLPPT